MTHAEAEKLDTIVDNEERRFVLIDCEIEQGDDNCTSVICRQ